jgi:hypothetical protein
MLCWTYRAFDCGRRRMTRDVASGDILAVWKRAAPRNRMREILTSGSVGGLIEQSLALPGQILSGCEVVKDLQHPLFEVFAGTEC